MKIRYNSLEVITMLFRVERDEFGEVEIPLNAYYGIATHRAKENFSITKEKVHKQMIKSLAIIKKACCLANYDAGFITREMAKAIASACDEVINGRFTNQFLIDAIQGGGGLAINMNMNEVIANRANEIMGGTLGKYEFVHPTKHVNLCQSTNDVIPTAAKLTILFLSKPLLSELKKLLKLFQEKSIVYRNTMKIGRTHLQDSLPISIGQQFGAIATTLSRDIVRFQSSLNDLHVVHLGTGSIGVESYVMDGFVKSIMKRLNEFSDIRFAHPENPLDMSRNLDDFVNVSHVLKLMAINLSKTASDIRLMASGPNAGLNELILPKVETCTGLLINKNNPTIAEIVNQVCFQVIGKDTTITLAAEHGQLELNVFGPIVYPNLFDSIDYLTRSLKLFRESTVEGMIVNEAVCERDVTNSLGSVVGLLPRLGLQKCSEIMEVAAKENRSIKEIVLAEGLLSEEECIQLLSVNNIRQLKDNLS